MMVRRLFAAVLFVFALFAVLFVASAAEAVERVKMVLQVNSQAKTYHLYARVWDYSIPPEVPDVEPGDIPLGFATILLDIYGYGDIELGRPQPKLPLLGNGGTWFPYIVGGGQYWDFQIAQFTVQGQSWVTQNVGLFGWQEICSGSYTGSGMIVVASKPQWLWGPVYYGPYAGWAMLFGNYSTGWQFHDVFLVPWGDVIDVNAVAP